MGNVFPLTENAWLSNLLPTCYGKCDGACSKAENTNINIANTSSQSTSLTYEEGNAIRYVGEYVIKSVKAMLKSPQDDELTLGLDELCITDDDV